MYCATCGQTISEGATVCGNCGSAAASPGDPASAAQSPGVGSPPTGPAYGAGAAAVSPAGTLTDSLVSRVRAILVTPRTEWPVIAAEATSAQDIYLRYVAPLVAIGVVASLIGSVLIGIPVPMLGTVRVGVGTALAAAILHFVLTFVAVFVVAMIVDALAPTFGGQKDSLRALKVTAYSFTPAWVAAILTILPVLGFIAGLIGLYGLYLLYLGLPVLMRAPADKALGYTVVVVLCAIVLSIIVSAITGLVTGGPTAPM
jgi:hypothetical protein